MAPARLGVTSSPRRSPASAPPGGAGSVLPAGRWIVALVTAVVAMTGCFDEPELEDRWTRLDIQSASLVAGQVLPPGVPQNVTVSADITYRKIVTGFAVAELRASSLPASAVMLHPNAPRLQMAQDIDWILQNSVTMGRATRAITGWDHLIQHFDFSFTGAAPAVPDSNSAGLFLLFYLGSGVEVELANGADSIVVTPFDSETMELLPVGLELGTN